MSKITHANMTNYINKINDLNRKFLLAYKENYEVAQKCIEEMRIIHGDAILDAYDYCKNISQNRSTISNADRITVSGNDSFKHLIHRTIRECEILLFNQKKGKGNDISGILSSDTNINNAQQNRIKPTSFDNAIANNSTKLKIDGHYTFRPNANGTGEELSLGGSILNTENGNVGQYTDNLNLSELFEQPDGLNNKNNQNNSNGVSNTNLKNINSLSTGGYKYSDVNTDIIDRLTSTEAANLLNDHKQTNSNTMRFMNGGAQMNTKDMDVNKPTVIKYFANWCGPSNGFKPTWDEIVATLNAKYPNVQHCTLDVGHDKELMQLAQKVGVKGYPTVIIFYNGKIIPYEGKRTTSEFMEFLNKRLNA